MNLTYDPYFDEAPVLINEDFRRKITRNVRMMFDVNVNKDLSNIYALKSGAPFTSGK